MPPVTADDDSSKLIAYLIIVPFAILFAGLGLAISCSEKWNKSDNRLKRFLQRRKSNKKRSLTSVIKTEDTTKSEAGCDPVPSQGSSNTITVTDPLSPSEWDQTLTDQTRTRISTSEANTVT
jgi:GRB2-binding adapter (GAPT)